MSRRKSTPILDPIETMHKAMRLAEACAAREQQKGENANLKLMCEHMATAAGLAEKIAAIQDRRGITSDDPPPKVDLEILGVCIDCGKKFPVDELVPAPDRNRPPRTIDATALPVHISDAHPLSVAKSVAPPKPTPLKPDYHPAVDFAAKETCIKGSIVNGSYGYLGMHKAPSEFKS